MCLGAEMVWGRSVLLPQQLVHEFLNEFFHKTFWILLSPFYLDHNSSKSSLDPFRYRYDPKCVNLPETVF